MRRRSALAVVTAAALLLAGCTEEPEEIPEISVGGEPGGPPELTYETPLEVEEPLVEVVRQGDGPELTAGGPVLLNFHAESGADGTVINETYSTEPRPYPLTTTDLGGDIFDALVGQTVGSRVLAVVPPVDGQPTTVAVFDILPTRAWGEPVEPREGLPTVTLGPDGAPSIEIPPDTPPPSELVVQPLLRGDGPQVLEGQLVTVQFTGVRWSDGTVYDSSWAPDKLPVSFPIGVGSLLAGWDEGLVEQTVGSQVLLVVPPALAYGGTDHELAEETLVFVVDILAAGGGPQP